MSDGIGDLHRLRAAAAALLMAAAGAHGALILEESFIFSTTNLQGQGSGSGFAAPWQTGVGGSDFITVAGLSQAAVGRLAARGFAVADGANAASTIYRDMAAPLRESVVYLSFLARYGNAFSSYVGLGTGSHDNVYSTASFRVARVDSTQQLGWWDPVASRWMSTGIALATEQTYLIVVKAVKGGSAWGGGDDSLSFWLNPAIGGAEPAPTWTSGNLNFGTLDTSRLLVGTNWNGPVIDEVRLGTDWASVTPQAPETCSLAVAATNGSVTRSPDKAGYAYGESVTMTAVAASGYIFSGWAGDASGLANPLTLPVTANLQVTAQFMPAAQGLKITVDCENGTVAVDPLKDGYAQGETVTLTAVPDPGYRFDGWNKEVLDYRASATVTMSGDLLAAPRFTPAPHGAGGAGADVREEYVKTVLHVDAASGSDANPGTEAQPFKTIGRAFSRAEQLLAGGTGVKVLIRPGVYREETRPPAAQFTAPLVIEGAGWTPSGGNTGDVIITGAAPLTGLTLNADGVYELPWTSNWGSQADPFATSETPTPPGILRYEWVWHGDRAFIHVFSYAELLARTEGHHIYVDEAADKLYLKGPAGVDLAAAGLEMTRFASGAPSNANFLMWIKGSSTSPRSHIVVRNLVFEKGAPGAFRAALHIHNAANIMVEDVVGRLNHSIGVLADDCNYSTLRDIEVSGNTIQGLGGGQSVQSRFERVHIHGNCEVAYLNGYLGWSPCGIKFGDQRQATLADFLIEDNFNHGLWLDTGTKLVEIIRLRSINNARNGVYFENNNRNNMSGLGDTKTAVLRHSVIAGNGERSAVHAATGGATSGGSGLFYVESENLIIEESAIFNHDENIMVAYNNRGPISNFAMRDSVVGEPAGQSDSLYRQTGNILAWQQFFDTISGEHDYNRYYDADAKPFPDRALAALTLDEWKLALSGNPFRTGGPASPDFNSAHIRDQARADYRILAVEPLAAVIREGAQDVPVVRFTRVQADLSAPMAVAYALEAAPGRAEAADFAGGLSGTVTIPAGAMHADLVLSPLADGLAEGPEILAVTVAPVPGYDQFYDAAVVEIGDNEVPDLPRVSIAARAATVTEGSDWTILFDVTRTGATDAPLTVSLSAGGTSAAGSDWHMASTLVEIPAGSAGAEVGVSVLDDTVAELPETLVVTVQRPAALTYAPAAQSVATVTIRDDDLTDPKSVLRSEPVEGRAASFGIAFQNPTAEAFTYTLQPVANTWDVQTLAQLDWVAPSGTPVGFTYVVSNDDGVSAAVPLGFAFPYFGNNYESVYIHTNGFLTFVPLQNPSDGYRVPVDLPAAATVNPFTIAPYWRNWGLDTTSRVYAQTDAEGNFVVTYKDLYQMPAFPTKRRATWQVMLRPSGQIEFRYQADATLGSYVIGLQGADGAQGFTLGKSGYAKAGLRVCLTPVSAFLPQLPQQVVVAPGSRTEINLPYDSRHVETGVYTYNIAYQPADLALPQLLIPVQFRVGVGLSAAHWPASTGHADFWTQVDGFGWVYDAFYPVVNHAEHGWLYLAGTGGTPDFYYYEYTQAQWAYTSLGAGALYPWITFFDGANWQWKLYITGTASPRYFWDGSAYVAVP